MPTDSNIIQAGPGVEGLKPRGHARNEQKRKRTDNLDKIADGLMNRTDAATYSVDPSKLKEEPEILKHLNFAEMAFEVTRPRKGYVYVWCPDRNDAIALKRTEGRMWLGAQSKGWEIVSNCSCTGKHDSDCPFPESLEVKAADGRRVIGDVFLMRMDLDEYTLMHKRMILVQQYRERNVPEPMSEWVKRHEGVVKVVSGNKTPDQLYADVQRGGGPLQHKFRGRMVTAAGYDEE